MMNSPTINDDSILRLNSEELKINRRRKSLDFNQRNDFKKSEIVKDPIKLSKSITKNFLKRRKKKNSQKPEKNDNVIKEYLHSHKFEIKRKNSKKITVKQFKRNFIQSNFSNKNVNECASMMLYPTYNSKKNIKIKEEKIINIENEKRPNLKKVGNLLINKLANMRLNFQNELNTDDISNIKRKSIKNKSVKYNFNKDTFNFNKRDIKDNKISLFTTKNANNYKAKKSLVKHLSLQYDKGLFLDKMKDITSEYLKLAKFQKNINMKIKHSSKKLLPINKPKDKSRNLYRVNPIYDSFDDDESDKDDDEFCLLPNSYYILILDLLVFLSTIYNALYLPLRMAKLDCFCNDENIINTIILYLIDILYIFDFSLSFFRAYYNYQIKLVKNKVKIITNYLKSDFLLDFIEAIPFVSYSNFLCANNKEINYCFHYNISNNLILLKILNNIKIIKILKVRNKQKNITLNSLLNLFSENYSLEKLIDNLTNFLHCLLAFNFFVCLNIFLAKQTYPNWLITINGQDESLLYNYLIFTLYSF